MNVVKAHKIASIADLKRIELKESDEGFACYCNPQTPNSKRLRDGLPIPSQIIVRLSVALKLKRAAEALTKINPDLKLVVLEGFRSLRDQREHFEKMKAERNARFASECAQDIDEQVHLQIAEPSVAGHPTGAAVDVTLYCKNMELDFGGKAGDVCHPARLTFFDHLSDHQLENRLLLRRVMMQQQFAPFDAEWWHFSYGDCEWAFFYDKAFALYGAKMEPSSKHVLSQF